MVAHFSRIPHTLAVAGLLLVAASCAQANVAPIAPERLAIGTANDASLLPYCASHDLKPRNESGNIPGASVAPVAHEEIRRLLIMVHGTLRNAPQYHDLTMRAVRAAGLENETLVVTPQFLMVQDLNAARVDGNVLFWSNAGWKQGDLSRSTMRHPRTERISSYRALEMLVEHVVTSGIAPQLQEIVIAGHSAGGQFVNRFAIGSRYVDELTEQGFNVRYVVSCPSSYLYLCEARWCDVEGDFCMQSTNGAACAEFSRYKFGLDSLNTFMSQTGSKRMIASYPTRRVAYLVGALDNDPNGRFLDTRCSAMLQGATRLDRAVRYHQYLGWRFGEAVLETHTKHIVPGVGHDARGIFTSAEGLAALFDHGAFDDRTTFHASERQ